MFMIPILSRVLYVNWCFLSQCKFFIIYRFFSKSSTLTVYSSKVLKEGTLPHCYTLLLFLAKEQSKNVVFFISENVTFLLKPT